MQTGSAQLEKRPVRFDEQRQIVFIRAVELPCPFGLFATHDAVNTHESILRQIAQQKVIEEGIETIHLQARLVIDERSRTTQLFDEDLVAQSLRFPQIVLVSRQGHGEYGRGRPGHGKLPRDRKTGTTLSSGPVSINALPAGAFTIFTGMLTFWKG
jgi:hypothetical protein